MKKALIIGISGQDGSYLSKFLLEKDYKIWGTSRDPQISSFCNLQYLGIEEKVRVESQIGTSFLYEKITDRNFLFVREDSTKCNS